MSLTEGDQVLYRGQRYEVCDITLSGVFVHLACGTSSKGALYDFWAPAECCKPAPPKSNRVSKPRGERIVDDHLSDLVSGMSLEELYEFAAEKLEQPVDDLYTKYLHLNVGMQAMNLRNRLRRVV